MPTHHGTPLSSSQDSTPSKDSVTPERDSYIGTLVQKDPREIRFEQTIDKWIEGEVDYDTVRRSVPSYYRRRKQTFLSLLIDRLHRWIDSSRS